MALVTFVNDSAPYLSAENLNNNFNELNNKIQSNIATETVTINNISINSGATVYKSFTIPSKSGYVAIAVVMTGLSGAGSGYSLAVPTLWGDLTIHNGYSSSITINATLKVIYLKN